MSANLPQIISGYTELGYDRRQATNRACHYRLHRQDSRGHGNRANRRKAMLEAIRETDAWFTHFCQLTTTDVDNLAQDRRINYHE